MGRKRLIHAPGPVNQALWELDPMSILAPITPARNVNSLASANPRDSWPDWTDDYRWDLAPVSDDYRPTAGPDFIPTSEEDAEAVELFNIPDHDSEPTDAEWDARADDAYAMDRVCSGPIL
jgi:hypothetical protein